MNDLIYVRLSERQSCGGRKQSNGCQQLEKMLTSSGIFEVMKLFCLLLVIM